MKNEHHDTICFDVMDHRSRRSHNINTQSELYESVLEVTDCHLLIGKYILI